MNDFYTAIFKKKTPTEITHFDNFKLLMKFIVITKNRVLVISNKDYCLKGFNLFK